MRALFDLPGKTALITGAHNYSFVRAMGGENQEFSDMDPVDMQVMK